MKKFRIVTLGCRTNQYEGQAYRDQLEGLGYREAKGDEAADLCVVNTCTVTAGADRDSRHAIRKLVREHPGAEVVVTGCMAEGMKPIEGVSRVVPNRQKERLLNVVLDEDELPEFQIKHFEAHTRAFVKVQDGCNSFCTYCIIPYVRGRSRSREVGDVVREVEGLVAGGYKEVVITGINVGDFEGGLPQLMRAVDGVEELERLRLSSIDPDEVDDELLDVVLNGKRTCHSFHIVLQAGSNRVLKRMNRKYTKQMFLETVERLKTADPDFAFTTDVIVGFPGETEADFEETLEVVRRVKFAKVHMFPYSRRERTRAALYKDEIPPEVMRERKARLLEVAEQTAFELREPYVGRKMTVLTESTQGGHTDNFLWVDIDGVEANQLVEVELVANTPKGLEGVVRK